MGRKQLGTAYRGRKLWGNVTYHAAVMGERMTASDTRVRCCMLDTFFRLHLDFAQQELVPNIDALYIRLLSTSRKHV